MRTYYIHPRRTWDTKYYVIIAPDGLELFRHVNLNRQQAEAVCETLNQLTVERVPV